MIKGATSLASLKLEGMAPLLQVFDMPVSLRFYRDQLGFEVKMSSGEGDECDWVLLSRDGIEIMLNTAYEKQHRPDEPMPDRVTAHRDITIYFGCPDITAAYQYLLEKGLPVQPPVITGYGWQALHITDPDGYQLCFHYPQ